MRLTLSAIGLLAVTACTTTPVSNVGGQRPNAPVAGFYPTGLDDTCDAEQYAVLIGQDATALERILILREVRVIRPGSIVTQDYKPERLNFDVGTAGTITSLSCG
ncbi:I78 family peptidase inhibitor [Yoonia sp. 208BN28-4]|uniref:I78 family peptidase inhibitor n=1 Tax=Yoonia sp. 208BN28-4 TaxID=3126505 RepID=UPI0030B50925